MKLLRPLRHDAVALELTHHAIQTSRIDVEPLPDLRHRDPGTLAHQLEDLIAALTCPPAWRLARAAGLEVNPETLGSRAKLRELLEHGLQLAISGDNR